MNGNGNVETDVRRLRENLRDLVVEAVRSERMSGPDLSALRHYLRTPIHHIIGYSEMLAEDALEDGRDGIVPDLERIAAAAKVLNEFLDFLFAPVDVKPGEGDAGK